jgi:transposase
LGILPTGYIYPPELRAVRDMLRRRSQLVRLRSKQLSSIQNQIWRSKRIRVKSGDIKRKRFAIPYLEGLLLQSAQANLTLYRAIDFEIKQLETTLLKQIELAPEFKVLKSIIGVGDVLGMTIMFETGNIKRFASMGNYSSYCRCVKSVQ